MPLYTFECDRHGHRTEIFIPLRAFGAIQYMCETSGCGGKLHVAITAPLMVKASADVRYDSPIDGAPITSRQARQEDLKRNNCTPYDPEQRTDYHNRIKESEAALDKSIDVAVESAIEKMPTAKRGKLYSELTEQGVTADVIRQ